MPSSTAPRVSGRSTAAARASGTTPTDGGIGLRYFPLYLRAQRHGNMVMTFRSDDGKLWEQTTKEQELDLPATTRVGIFSSSDGGSATTLGTAHFDNFTTGPEVLK